MQFLAHRGQWLQAAEKNTPEALIRALTNGWGIETDIRDLDGELVISHDMPHSGAFTVQEFFETYSSRGFESFLALNIKSDGLTDSLKKLFIKYNIWNYFCFDMSVPDTLIYLKENVKTAIRVSEYECEGKLSSEGYALWVDSFTDKPLDIGNIYRWVTEGKKVCLVSPELHHREPYDTWHRLARLPEHIRMNDSLMLCTDQPAMAREIIL